MGDGNKAGTVVTDVYIVIVKPGVRNSATECTSDMTLQVIAPHGQCTNSGQCRASCNCHNED